jgi:hypothetical protein
VEGEGRQATLVSHKWIKIVHVWLLVLVYCFKNEAKTPDFQVKGQKRQKVKCAKSEGRSCCFRHLVISSPRAIDPASSAIILRGYSCGASESLGEKRENLKHGDARFASFLARARRADGSLSSPRCSRVLSLGMWRLYMHGSGTGKKKRGRGGRSG